MFGWNADAGVFDGDNDFIIFLNGGDGDRAIFGGILQGVRCEVGEDLRDAVFVSEDMLKIGWQVRAESDAFCRRLR